MRSRLVSSLRVASIVSLLFATGHTLGGLKAWSPTRDNHVLRAMGAYAFHVEGVSRTYLDFYLGFGFSLSVFMLLESLVLWQLATLANRDNVAVRPIVAAFTAASLVITGISWALIMPVPALFSAGLTACLVAALLASRRAGDETLTRPRGGVVSPTASA